MTRSAAVGSGVLAWGSLSFARRNLWLGPVRSDRIDEFPPRDPTASGTVAGVDGQSVSIELASTGPLEGRRLLVARRGYPAGERRAEAVSEPLELDVADASTTVEVTVPKRGREPGRWFYECFLTGAEDDDTYAFLCESAPRRWDGAESRAARRIAAWPGPTATRRFRRERRANTYTLEYEWRDGGGKRWSLEYRLRRSVHEAAVDRDRGYVRTFEDSLSAPLVSDVAETIGEGATREDDGSARAHAVTSAGGAGLPAADRAAIDRPTTVSSLSEAAQFDVLVRFVQDLRYARDVETLGRYEYNRTAAETLVAGVGDCKDKTHLLGGLLSAALSCDVAMLFQPAHVLLGVAIEDVPAPFADREAVRLGGREYLPVDPSWRFEIGAYPDAPITAAYGSRRWLHYDVGAIGQGLDRNLHDLVANGVAKRG